MSFKNNTFLKQQKCVHFLISWHLYASVLRNFVINYSGVQTNILGSFLSFVRIFRLSGGAPPCGVRFVGRWKGK